MVENIMMLEFDRPTIFPQEIFAAVSVRNIAAFPHTGFSPGGCGELLDDEELTRHRAILADAAGLPVGSLKFQRQIHSDIICKIGRDSNEAEADGMITAEANIGLCISTADCAAVLVYCTASHSIGAFHSGWRGSHLRISSRGIDMMCREFGASPQSMFAYISPCAGGKDYEVGSEVAFLFSKIYRVAGNKYMLDIRAEICAELTAIGIPASHIECSQACTIRNNRYHSYRRDRKLSGRMASVIALRS